MSEFIQTIILGSILILTLGFILYRLSVRTKSMILNEAPSCHSDGKDEACDHCRTKAINQ